MEEELLHSETGLADDIHQDSGIFPPFNTATYTSQLFWLILTFGLLYIVLQKIAVPRISGILESRRNRIEGDLAEAERLKQETEKSIAAYEQAMADARGKAQSIAQETQDRLSAESASQRKAVEADLAGKLSEAETRITQMQQQAMAQVDAIAVDLTQTLLQTLTGETLPEQEAAQAVNAVDKAA